MNADKIEWRSGTNGLRRATVRAPGYDCRDGKCKHEKKGDHGWHADEWHFVVSNGASALVLQVSTAYFADDPVLNKESIQSYRRIFDNRPDGYQRAHGSMIIPHFGFPSEEDDVRSGSPGTSCSYVEGGRCWSDGGRYTLAESVFSEHGNPWTMEQSEGLWLELEKLFVEIVGDAERERSRCKQCPTCAGKGIVELGSK